MSGAAERRVGWRRRLRALSADSRGGVALMTAMALPPLLLIGVGAVELQGVAADRTATQSVADSAALWGAQQMSVTPVGVEARTEAFARPQLEGILARADVTVAATAMKGGLLKVAVDTHRPSFFMNLMPAGGFYTHAESTAQAINRLPLCVLTFGAQTGDQARLKNGAAVQAGGCMVHAKGDIKVDGNASLTAGMVETESGKAQGTIAPAAGTGAAPVPDPFATTPISFPAPCTGGKNVTVSEASPLTLQPPPGQSWLVVQDTIAFDTSPAPIGGGVLTLKPGEYYFCKTLTAEGGDLAKKQQDLLGPASKHGPKKDAASNPPLIGAVTGVLNTPALDTASIVGDDVVLIFADGAKLTLKKGSSLTLNGRKTGALAGFVLVGGLTASGGNFSLNADQIQSLLGTVYIRNTPLEITGTLQMAAASAWTVIVANSLLLDQSTPGILINSNYAASTVPRPVGVGDAASKGTAILTR